jgi:hypothetical protein
LVIFYVIFCRYFTLSALQIRYGLPDTRKASSLTNSYDSLSCIGYRIFYILPFLLELKVILDWCFTKTSLDVFQWLELAQVHSEFYFYKCSNTSYFKRPWGEQIKKFEKYLCGCFCIGLIMFFLAGPFLFFSNLSAIAKPNLITDAELEFGIKIVDGNSGNSFDFKLFESMTPLNLDTMQPSEFNLKGYG